MPDQSAATAQMIYEGTTTADPNDFDAVVDAIIDRFPNVTADEIERGFQIAVELGYARDAEGRVCG